jgi:filamentous hemagglutinin family protein
MIWRSCLFFLSSVAPIRSGQSAGICALLPQTGSMKAIAKNPSPRRCYRMVRGSLLGLTSALLWALPGAALPQTGTVSTGQAEIQQPNAERLNIVQTSERAVINWNSFNIGSSEWVNFQQPSATSATLNRVTGGFTSEIAGRLTANGQVYLVNPNGILFTPTAQVNVGSFLATTLDIQNTDFMQGQLRFRQTLGKVLSTVENEGNITVAEGGFAALVAPGVANRGVMNAYLGSVVLGSGTEATLDFYGDGLFSFAVDPTLTGQIFGSTGQPLNALVSNSGKKRHQHGWGNSGAHR